jgi:4-carboxymuconolactone decarboxylase
VWFCVALATGAVVDATENDGGEMVERKTTGELVPQEIRTDWEAYVDRTIRDVWQRPALAPRDRSLVTIASLAVQQCPTELDIQIRNGLKNGLSRLELCEAMLQVSGYAGVGRGVEGLRALRTVFDDVDPELGADPGDLPPGVEGDRLERARYIQAFLTEHVDLIMATLVPYGEGVPAAERPPFHAGRKEWLGWLTETAFGDLWSRPNLTLAQREMVTAAVLITLGRHDELRSHLHASLRFGISPEEMTEILVQLAVYAGYPTMVGAMLQYTQVLAEHGLAEAVRHPD